MSPILIIREIAYQKIFFGFNETLAMKEKKGFPCYLIVTGVYNLSKPIYEII
jgi:hypothetical protein